jgi:hypothetical protein
MIDVALRKTQFAAAIKETEILFGGADKLKMLARAKHTSPDALIAGDLPKQEKIPRFQDYASEKESLIAFFDRANLHLGKLLKNSNISHELLNPNNNYIKHLNESEIRNWKADQLTNAVEFTRTTSYLLTLRIDGPTRTPEFNAKNFVEASKIRSS